MSAFSDMMSEEWNELSRQRYEDYRPLHQGIIVFRNIKDSVALNSAWHDFSCWAREKFSTDTEVEVAVVELAIAYWFNDADYEGDGKVWRTLSGK